MRTVPGKHLFGTVLWALTLAVTTDAVFLESLAYEDLAGLTDAAPAFLIFTVPWCEYCKTLKSEVKALSHAAAAAGDAVSVALVDGELEPAIAQKLHVYAFPSMLFLPTGFSLKRIEDAEEFSDYRWAELMAEFINNETGSATIEMTPRKSFLAWRKKVPYNRGKSPRQILEPPQEQARALRSKMEAEADALIPSPVALTAESFDDVAIRNASLSTLVFFYTPHDVDHDETMLQWRQASAVFSPEEDGILIAMLDVSAEGDAATALLEKHAQSTETPATILFSRCPLDEQNQLDCKRAQVCGEGECQTTEQLMKFLSDGTMERLGLADMDPEDGDVLYYEDSERSETTHPDDTGTGATGEDGGPFDGHSESRVHAHEQLSDQFHTEL